MSKLLDIISLVEEVLFSGKKATLTDEDFRSVLAAARRSEYLEDELRKYKQHVCDVCDGDGTIGDGVVCMLCKGSGMVESH